MPQLCRRPSHQVNVATRLYEGLADGIDTLFQRKLQAVTVVVGKGANAQVYPRQVQPLARAQLAPGEDGALDVFALNAHDFQLNDAVIEKYEVASLDHRRQTLEGHEGVLLIAGDLLRGQRECIPRF